MKVQARRLFAAVTALAVVLVGCDQDDTELLTADETAAVAFLENYDRDEPAALVGNVAIDSTWLFDTVEEMLDVRDPDGELAGAQRAVALENLFKQMLSAVVVKEVIVAIAADKGVSVSDDDIEEEIAAARQRLGGETSFREMLAESGITLSVYRDLLVPWELYQQRLETKLRDDYTPQEFRDVRHILVETEDEAAAAFARIQAGEPFGTVAEELSLDTLSGQDGGELGASEPGRFVTGFEEIVWAAAIGDLLGPLQTEFGFHVAEVTDIRIYAKDELDEVTLERLLVTELNQLMTQKMETITIIINPKVGQWDRNEGTIVPF